ncbi:MULTISPECIES: hypothetical protein [unclassified Azospirillum]|uniref:hypothetical protein n=1 Tax=unclassified Azospirillum TaxID=2630922 RepID=UPI0011B2906B|nr:MULTISPECIES: hypothetical protein [unclassified Azospirillum]
MRDRAILLLGFAGRLWRSEIVSLDHGAEETADGRRLGRCRAGQHAAEQPDGDVEELDGVGPHRPRREAGFD